MHVDTVPLLTITAQSRHKRLDGRRRIGSMKITLGFGSLKKCQSFHVKWPFHSLEVLGTSVFFKGFLFKHDPRQGKPDRLGAAKGNHLGGLWEAPPPGPHLWASWLGGVGQAA